VVLPGVARLVEQLMRLMCRKPLIPKMDGQAAEFAKLGRERLNLLGLAARLTIELYGIANDDSCHRISPAQTRNRSQIFARVPSPFQGQNGLSGKPELIGNSDSNTLRSYVERQISWNLLVRHPCSS
jgi:hypothetical protein